MLTSTIDSLKTGLVAQVQWWGELLEARHSFDASGNAEMVEVAEACLKRCDALGSILRGIIDAATIASDGHLEAMPHLYSMIASVHTLAPCCDAERRILDAVRVAPLDVN